MKSYFFLLIISSLLLSFSFGQECGQQASWAPCPPHKCCNKDGFCGNTVDDCKVPGCQENCIECGIDLGGLLCPNNFCCSKEGFCGLTDAYCGDGCQSQCHESPSPSPSPTPTPSPSPTPSPTPSPECGQQASWAPCPPHKCCNKDGFCGNTVDDCKVPGCQENCIECGIDLGGLLCPNNFCCSHEGFCGLTDAYCGDGCQSQCHESLPYGPVDI